MSSSGDFNIQRIWTAGKDQVISSDAKSAKEQAFNDVIAKVKAASDPAFKDLQETLNTQYTVQFVKKDATGEITATFKQTASSKTFCHTFKLIDDDQSSINKEIIQHLREMWNAVMEEPTVPASSSSFVPHAAHTPLQAQTGTSIVPDQGTPLDTARQNLLEQVQTFKNTGGSDPSSSKKQLIETHFTNREKTRLDSFGKRLFSEDDLTYLPNTDDTTLKFLDLALLEDIQACLKDRKFEEAALTITLLDEHNKTAILKSLNISNPDQVTFSTFERNKGSLVAALKNSSFHPQPIIEGLKTKEILEITRYIAECKTKAQVYKEIEAGYQEEIQNYSDIISDLQNHQTITEQEYQALNQARTLATPTLEGVAPLRLLIKQALFNNWLIAQESAIEQGTRASALETELATLRSTHEASLIYQSSLICRLTDQAGSIKELTDSLALANTQIAQQQAVINELEAQLTAERSLNDELKAQIAAFEASLAAAHAHAAALEAQHTALEATHEAALAFLAQQHEAAIADLKASLEATQAAALTQKDQAHAAKLDAAKAEHTAAIETLQAAQAAEVAAFKATHEARLASLTRDKEKAEARAADIQKELASAQSQIQKQEATIASLEKAQTESSSELERLQQEARTQEALYAQALASQAASHDAAIEQLSADNKQALADVRQEAVIKQEQSNVRLRSLRAELKDFVHREQQLKAVLKQLSQDQDSARTTIEHLRMASQANTVLARTLYKDREKLLEDLSSKAKALLENATIDESQKTKVRSLHKSFEDHKAWLSTAKDSVNASDEAYLTAGTFSLAKHSPTEAEYLASYLKNQAYIQHIESGLINKAVLLSNALEAASKESFASLNQSLDAVTASYQEASAIAAKTQADLAAKETDFRELEARSKALESRLQASDEQLRQNALYLERQTTTIAEQNETIAALQEKQTSLQTRLFLTKLQLQVRAKKLKDVQKQLEVALKREDATTKSLQLELATATARIDELSSQQTQIQARLKALEEEKSTSLAEISRLNAEKTAQDELIETLNHQKTALETQLAEHQSLAIRLQEQIGSQLRLIEAQGGELATLKTTLDAANQLKDERLEQLKRTNGAFAQFNASFEKSLSDATRAFDEALSPLSKRISEATDKLRALEEAKRALLLKKDTLETTVRDLTQANEALTASHAEETTALNAALAQARAEQASIQEMLASANQQLDQTRATLTQQQAEIASMQSSHEAEMRKQHDAHQQAIEALQHTLTEQSQAFEEAKTQHEKALQTLQQQLSAKGAEHAAQAEKLRAMIEEKEGLQRDLSEVKAGLDTLNNTLREEISKTAAIEQEKEALIASIKKLEEGIGSLKEENTGLKEALTKQQEEHGAAITSLETSLSEKDVTAQSLLAKIKALTDEKTAKEERLATLTASLTAVSAADAEKDFQIQSLQKALKARIEALTTTSLAEKEKASALQHQLTLSQNAEALIRADFEKLKASAETIARENSTLVREKAALESYLKANLTAVLSELRKITPDLETPIVDALSGEALMDAHQTFTEQLFALYSQNLVNLEQERLKLATQATTVAELTVKTTSQQAQLQETTRSLETLQQALSQASLEKRSLQEALDVTQGSLKEKETEIQTLQARLTEALASSRTQATELQNLSSSLEKEQTAYKTLQRDHATLVSSLEAANATLSSLETVAQEREAFINKQAADLLEQQKSLNAAIEENTALKSSLHTKETEYARLEAILAKAQASIATAQQAQALSEASLQAEKEALAQEREAILAKHQQELDQMRAEMDATIARMEAEHAARIATLKLEHQAAVVTVSEEAQAALEAKIASIEATHQKAIGALTTRFAALQAEHHALQEASTLKDDQVARLSLELTTSREKFSTIQAERNAALEETAAVRAEFTAALATFRAKEAELQATIERLQEALKTNEALQDHLKRDLFNQLDIIIHPFINRSDHTVTDPVLAEIAEAARFQKATPSLVSLTDVIGLTNRSIIQLLTIFAEKTTRLQTLEAEKLAIESELAVAEKELSSAKPTTLKARIAAITLEIQRNKVTIDEAKKAAALAQAKEAATLRQKQVLGRENMALKQTLEAALKANAEIKEALALLISEQEALAAQRASLLGTTAASSVPAASSSLTGGSGTLRRAPSIPVTERSPSAVSNLKSAMEAAAAPRTPLLADFPQLTVENVDKVHNLIMNCATDPSNPAIKKAVTDFERDACTNLEGAFSILAAAYPTITGLALTSVQTASFTHSTPQDKADQIKACIEQIKSPSAAIVSGARYGAGGVYGSVSALRAAAALSTRYPG